MMLDMYKKDKPTQFESQFNSLFDTLSRNFTVGLDDVFKSLSTINLGANLAYPPCNIAKVGDNQWIIEMALAGFKKEDLSIELVDNVISIKGTAKTQETNNDSVYVYKGIASRSFSRSWVLQENTKVGNVSFENGLLSIHLEKDNPKREVKKLTIN